MALPNISTVPFALPGGEAAQSPRARPVDLAHLSRQTLGDRAVEQEVLSLFLQQATTVRDRIAQASPSERSLLAHGLRGSAGGIGAFAVAECATAIERDPHDKSLVLHLAARIDDVRDFIAAISR